MYCSWEWAHCRQFEEPLSWGITPDTLLKSLFFVPEATNQKNAAFATKQGQMGEGVQECG
jgi:hypothetical protein